MSHTDKNMSFSVKESVFLAFTVRSEFISQKRGGRRDREEGHQLLQMARQLGNFVMKTLYKINVYSGLEFLIRLAISQ